MTIRPTLTLLAVALALASPLRAATSATNAVASNTAAAAVN